MEQNARAMRIQTKTLTLVAQTPDDVRAMIESMTAEERAQLSAAWLALFEAATTIDPWVLGFMLEHTATGTHVGACMFKGPPDADGMVEIAYGIASAHQGRGYATEAAAALARFAFDSGQVRVVRAHTLSDANASSRVLVKCGFQPMGSVIDPEDGLVWRWERRDAPA
jgi:RimJ/RimL family protein N-acetyltransferase